MPEADRGDKRLGPILDGCGCLPLGANLVVRLGNGGEKGRSGSMDWDEITPKPIASIVVGESLTTLSVAELQVRIKELESEIERVKAELEAKRRHESAASAIFKR